MILSNIAKRLLLRYLRVVKHTCRGFQEKKIRQEHFPKFKLPFAGTNT